MTCGVAVEVSFATTRLAPITAGALDNLHLLPGEGHASYEVPTTTRDRVAVERGLAAMTGAKSGSS